MATTDTIDPRENTTTKQIFNHKCEVYYAPALLKFYTDEKDRNEILNKIEEQFFEYNSINYFVSHIDYKNTEIVWRSEYIEEVNILWIGVNINRIYKNN